MQKITVTLTTEDGIDAAAFVAALANRARYVSVQAGTRPVTIDQPVYASPGDITFVAVETVPDVEPVTVPDQGSHAAWTS